MRAMSLVSSEGDNEQNEMRSLQEKLEGTVTLVAQLSTQLSELKEQVDSHFTLLMLKMYDAVWFCVCVCWVGFIMVAQSKMF